MNGHARPRAPREQGKEDTRARGALLYTRRGMLLQMSGRPIIRRILFWARDSFLRGCRVVGGLERERERQAGSDVWIGET